MEDTQVLWQQTYKVSPRFLLWGLLILLAFMLFYPINYSLTTAFTFAMVPVAISWILLYPQTPLIRKEEFEPVLFLFVWLGYSLCSYIWAQDRLLAVDYSMLIFRYLFLFMLFSAAFRDHRLLSKLHLFLVVIAVLYIVTAVWEIVTFKHLSPSKYYGHLYFRPTGPFYGVNDLAAFMQLFLPFLLFLPNLYSKRWIKIGALLSVLITIFVIVVQGARIAMLAIGAVLVWFLTFHTKARTWVMIFLLIALIWGVLNYYVPSLLSFGWKMFSREVNSFDAESTTVQMSSINIRKQLFSETFDLVTLSGFMGVGGGNFEHYMDTDREFRTAGIINPHNWLLEIVGNFGVIILAGFLYIYLRWLYLLYMKYRSSSGREKSLSLMYLVSLVLYLASSSLPSSIRWHHLIWVYFAGINAFCFSSKPIYKDSECTSFKN